MCDLLEGVIPNEIKLLLEYVFSRKKMLQLKMINQRLKSFNFGYSEVILFG